MDHGENLFGEHQAEDDHSEGDNVFDSSEEEEDEEVLPEDHDFIVDGDDSDDGGRHSEAQSEDEEERRKRKKREKKEKRKRKKHRQLESELEDLDEDDLELLAETTGIRPPKPSKKDQFRRLKRRKMSIDSDGEDPLPSGGLNGDDDDLPSMGEAISRSSRKRRDQDLSHIFDDPTRDAAYDDDEDDFIVHDDGERDGPSPRRRAPIGHEGISPDQWQDMFDIFGDGTDYGWAMDRNAAEPEEEPQTPTQKKSSQSVPLSAVFEPAELASQMMTEKDEKIRQTDIPERMQLAGITAPISEDEEKEEALFITTQLAEMKGLRNEEITDASPLYETVQHIVRFLRFDMLEVPFIAQHRTDYWNHPSQTRKTIDKEDLWLIHDLGEQYRAFRQKKMRLLQRYEALKVSDDYFVDLLGTACKIEHVEDLSDYMVFEHAERVLEILGQQNNKTARGASRIETYKLYRNPELEPFIRAFGVSPRVYATQLTQSKRVFDDDVPETPEDFAAKFLDRTPFKNVNSLIRGVKNYLSDAFSKEPEVRKYIRTQYEKNVVVSVTPTPAGKRVITPSHPFYPFKYLKDKPATKFSDGQFLLIIKGEEDGLLNVSVHLREEYKFFQELSSAYLSDGMSDFSDNWNEHRVDILRTVLETMKGLMHGSAKEQMKKRAIAAVGREFRSRFEDLINVAPLPGKLNGCDTARVMVISLQQGPNRTTQVYCVRVSETGHFLKEIVDDENFTRLPGLLDSLEEPPDVLLLAGNTNLQLRRIWERLAECSRTQLRVPIPVRIIDDEVGRLYQYSKRAKLEFPTASPVVRYSMALARLVQNPVMEYAAMFDQDNTIATLRVHPQQHLLSNEDVMKFFERSMVDVCNDVGVDINEAVHIKHRSGILRFMAGLGPRKAAAILKKVSRLPNGLLTSRDDLVEKKLMGQRVFQNCASTIRIRKKYEDKANVLIDILDDTRIPPEDYQIARKMAADALDVDHEEEAEYPSQHVQKVVDEVTDTLGDLQLDDYADYIMKQFQQPKRQSLEAMKQEMTAPYEDRRRIPPETSMMDVFKIISGETSETLDKGKVVFAEVTRVLPKLVICRLDSGLEGTIHVSEVTNQGRIETPAEIVNVGDSVKCKVLSIDFEAFKVQLSMKQVPEEDSGQGADPPPPEAGPNVERDDFFDKEEEQSDLLKVQKAVVPMKQALPMKSIGHPLFKKMNQEAAEVFLRTKVRGEAVVRPSTRGPDFLTVSWKCWDGVYCHFDVHVNERDNEFKLEPPPEKRNVAADEYPMYQELDELIVQHVEASARHIDELESHRKFKQVPEPALDNELDKLKQNDPGSIPYGICAATEFPTYFVIKYKNHATKPAGRAFIKVVPKGFKLKMSSMPPNEMDTVFNTVEELLNSFKERMMKAEQMAKQNQQRQRAPPPGPPPGAYGRGPPPHAGPPGWGAPPPRPMPNYGAYPPAAGPPPVPAGGGAWGGGNAWGSAGGDASGWGGSPGQGIPANNTAAAGGGGWGAGGWD